MFLNNRYHDPTLGTFISVDPLVTTTGEAYIYGGGNPISRSDPTGLCWWDVAAENLRCGATNYGHGQNDFQGHIDRKILEADLAGSVDVTNEMGMLPAIGDGMDATAAVVNLAQGDFEDAAWATGGVLVPFASGRVVRGVGEWLGGLFRGADEAVEASQVAARALAPEHRALALQNVTDSGDTVLGRHPGYINKANSRGASYFDIGDEWGRLEAQGIDPWDLNVEFLDTIGARGDRVLLSVPKADIPAKGYLRDEVNYLVNELDYVWVNQWSLRPRG